MREDELRALLAAVAKGAMSLEQAVERLAQLPFVDLGEADVVQSADDAERVGQGF